MTDADIFVGIGLASLLFVLAVILYKSVISRLKTSNFYYNHLIAYKVGLIKARAEAEKIVLVFPPDADELMDGIKDEVKQDLDRVM